MFKPRSCYDANPHGLDRKRCWRSVDTSARPVTRDLRCIRPRYGLCAGQKELPTAVVADFDVSEASAPRELPEPFVGVEVATARDRLRGGRCSPQLRSGRVHREEPTGAQHASASTKHADRIIEQEEDDGHRDSGERLVRERQRVSGRVDHLRSRRTVACQRHHVLAVVEPGHAGARRERVAEQEAPSAPDLEQVVARAERQRVWMARRAKSWASSAP